MTKPDIIRLIIFAAATLFVVGTLIRLIFEYCV